MEKEIGRMPVVFAVHGSPMNAIAHTRAPTTAYP